MTDLLTLLLATLSGMFQPGVTEQLLETKLAQLVTAGQPAPLKGVTVDATGVSASGADKVEFRFRELVLDELVVSRMTFTIEGVEKSGAVPQTREVGESEDPPRLTTRQISSGKLSLKGISWSAAIGDKELTTALRAEGGKMKDASVKIAPSGLTLRGKWPLAITKVSYGVTGNLEMDGSLLNFHIDKSDISGIGVPGSFNTKIEKEVNPVYDFASFAARSEKEIKLAREQLNYDFKLTVKKIEPKAGHIIVYGSA
ncbi:MAG: hypothetical protein M3R04_00560 [bacterium]|nr:hypothetical protein [bacterium]